MTDPNRYLSTNKDTQLTSTDKGHNYTSSACAHGKCGSCRQTCLFCGVPCQHICHAYERREATDALVQSETRNIFDNTKGKV